MTSAPSGMAETEKLAGQPGVWVICLCAEWCGLCRDYREVFEQAAAQHLWPGASFASLDIEDQADWMGDMDIETFPTLLVADNEGLLFQGTLTPHANTLSRLLAALQTPGSKKQPHSADTRRLLHELQLHPEFLLG